jgi:hypothetical protein
MSSSLLLRSPPLSPLLLLRRTNPNFAPVEIIQEEFHSALLLLHQGLLYPPPNDTRTMEIKSGHHRSDAIVMPRPDGVTFGMVLSACQRLLQWNAVLNAARAVAVYGVRLDGMALTLVLHSCQQLELVDEALYYPELRKCLGDDKGGVNCDHDGEGQAVGGSAMQQQQEQHPRGTGGDGGGRKTNGQQCKGARHPL